MRGWAGALRTGDFMFRLCITKETPIRLATLLSDLQILLLSRKESYRCSIWKGAELCSPEKKKKKQQIPIAAQQHKSREKRKKQNKTKAVSYDKPIYGTVDAAFRSRVRSLGENLRCGEPFRAHSELLGGPWLGEPAEPQRALALWSLDTVQMEPVWELLPSLHSVTQSWGLAHRVTSCATSLLPSRALWGGCCVLPKSVRQTGGADRNVLLNTGTSMG